MITTNAQNPVKHAQQAAEQAMQAVCSYLADTTAPTSEAAHEIIDLILVELGYSSPAGHIVAAGKQSAEPHEHGTGDIIPGTPIVIDIYPQSRETGYWGDITRTLCIGEPSTELSQLYDTVNAAMELAFTLIRPGVRCSDIHNAIADFFTEQGYETSGKGTEFAFAQGFVHALGHGVGIQIHQPPTLGAKSRDLLKMGDLITIEPGLYYQHIGGVRIEDIVAVTATGFENLTTFKKELMLASATYHE